MCQLLEVGVFFPPLNSQVFVFFIECRQIDGSLLSGAGSLFISWDVKTSDFASVRGKKVGLMLVIAELRRLQ